jgi:hypothetical protein
LIKENLPVGWSRDNEVEQASMERHKYDRDKIEEIICMVAPSTKDHPKIKIMLGRYSQQIEILNFYSEGIGSLSCKLANIVLDALFKTTIKKAVEKSGVSYVKKGGEQTIEELAGEETAKKLKVFSSGANKNTGSSHPLDQARWFDFIISAHNNYSKLSVTNLRRWLIENGWPEENACDLAIEYEFSKDLLNKYDEK